MTPDDKPNTPMTPREYVNLIAGPTLTELLARRDDQRLAYLACLTVYHCVDALGLAEAARVPGFDRLQGRSRRDALDTATKDVRDKVKDRCASAFEVVQGIPNGTKHPGKVPLLPGTERRIGVFGFGPEYAGFDEGRWDVPGLGLDSEDEVLFLDHCAQQVLATFICTYPAHLSGVALSSFMDNGLAVPGLAMPPEWLAGIGAWAAATPEIAEVWLFGSRAKGTSQADSDVDLGLVLVPGDPGHDWPLGNALSPKTRWREALEHIVGRHVSRELFARPGEEEGAPEVRATAILLWQRSSSGWLNHL